MSKKDLHVMIKFCDEEIEEFKDLKSRANARSNVDLVRRALAAYTWMLDQEELTTKDGVRIELRLL